VKSEKDATRFGLLAKWGAGWERKVAFPVVVTLVRHGPRLLDTDNLPGGLKGIRDQIALLLGVTDGPTDKRVSWRYDQARGPYGVGVRIEAAAVAKMEAAVAAHIDPTQSIDTGPGGSKIDGLAARLAGEEWCG
jgi:hypothetical protein